MIHGVLFNRGDGHSGIICRWHVHHPRYLLKVSSQVGYGKYRS